MFIGCLQSHSVHSTKATENFEGYIRIQKLNVPLSE